MRIGFDARMIDHPGIGRYIENLIGSMTALVGYKELILYGDPSLLKRFSGVEVMSFKSPIYSLSEMIFNPLKKYKLDVVHVPHFNVPGCKDKLIVTIHDLIYLINKGSAPGFIKNFVVKRMIKRAVNKAAKIIAVSENTKRDIISFLPEAKDKIEVIYEGCDSRFKVIKDPVKLEEISRKYSLPKDKKIILFVGSLKRHKNIEKLIEVYNSLEHKENKSLVIVGRFRPNEADILEKIKKNNVLYLGEVPIEDLVVLYNLANIFVMPSLYEGFGLTVLEAMASGLAVVSSFASSLREVGGDAALYFDPTDADDMACKIQSVLDNAKLREELINKGFENLKRFSWEKTALATLNIYKEVYAL